MRRKEALTTAANGKRGSTNALMLQFLKASQTINFYPGNSSKGMRGEIQGASWFIRTA